MYDVVTMPDLMVRYFSSNIWLGAFVVSIVYLFFRVNAAGKKAILGAIVAFLLVINALVIEKFTELGENATFYRHLWAIPSVLIIGIAIVDLIKKLPRWFLKIPAIAAVAVFLWFANQEYIRCREQIVSTDGEMVQKDVVQLGDEFEKLQKKTGKNILFISCPSGYSVPYGDMTSELNLYSGILDISSSSILNNEEHNGDVELMGENPDVPYIMATCCSKGIDYVVVARNDEAKNRFSEYGYEPAITSNSFLVFECNGYEGYKKDINRSGQIDWIRYYDKDGNPRTLNGGYSSVEYEYDTTNVITEKYFDPDGLKTRTSLGYAELTIKLNDVKQVIGERYYDADGTLLGEVNDKGTNQFSSMFEFLHCSNGVTIDNGVYSLSTNVPNNSFNMVHFQLFDAKTEEYLTDFGRGYGNGIIIGQYINEYPDGLYRLSIKGNTNLADEWLCCYVYLQKGELLDFSYSIDKIEQQQVVLSNLEVKII